MNFTDTIKQCNHTETYAVDTHNRIDCCTCDMSWDGKAIVKMEKMLEDAIETLKECTNYRNDQDKLAYEFLKRWGIE